MWQDNIHKALSSESRREIILFLGSGKKYLTEIADHIHRTPQTVDFHLNILENIGLIESSELNGKRFHSLKDKSILNFVSNRRPLPNNHHPKPPHEIILDVKDDLTVRMDSIEKKLDELIEVLKKNKK